MTHEDKERARTKRIRQPRVCPHSGLGMPSNPLYVLIQQESCYISFPQHNTLTCRSTELESRSWLTRRLEYGPTVQLGEE